MERMHTEHFNSMPISALEHRHRYAYAARFARGRVLDIACGIGYGAEFLCGPGKAQSYDGIDASEPAVVEARTSFGSADRTFAVGDIFSLHFPDETFDAVFTFETLEHVDRPSGALLELKRVMKPDGVLVGSVPDKDFEAKLTSRCGKNVFHLHHFARDELAAMLEGSFKHVQLGYAEVVIASRISQFATKPDVQSFPKNLEDGAANHGSFYFVCSNAPLPEAQEEVAGYHSFFKEHSSWLDLLRERDRRIQELESRLAKLSISANSK